MGIAPCQAARNDFDPVLNAPMLPAGRAEYEQRLNEAQAYLGQESFDSAWVAGTGRLLEEQLAALLAK